MNRTHLSDEQLIAHLYGIADDATKPHLDGCEECKLRWAAIEQRRRESILPAQPVSEQIFVRQRQAVLENTPPRAAGLRSAWLPAGAAALAIAAIVFLQDAQPTTPPASTPAPVLEAGWFDEAYASVSVEPRAAQPLRELFLDGDQSQ